MCGFENPNVGHFSATDEEKKKDPKLEKKLPAANQALKEKADEGTPETETKEESLRKAGIKARDSLGKAFEEDEEKEPEKKLEEVV